MIEIVMYGADWCPDCRRAKAFLAENDIEFEYIDLEVDQSAASIVEQINGGKRIIPTVLIDGHSHTNPDNATLSRALGINPQGRVELYGADWCPDCRRAKAFLDDNGIHYLHIDVDRHDWAASKVEEINNGKRIIPTILLDGEPHTNPDNARLSELLEIDREVSQHLYDVLIVGGGATGLTTAIYAQRDRLSSVIVEAKNIGGNAAITEKIENYPGFKTISGPELMDRMAEQAKVYGAEILTGTTVEGFTRDDGVFRVQTSAGELMARTLVLAVGSTYKRLGIPGEEELVGVGVHFCATCDGAFYRDREIITIGGGNTAAEESIFLSGIASKVNLVHRGSELTADQIYLDKMPSLEDKIDLRPERTPVAFEAKDDGSLRGLRVRTAAGEEELIEAEGAFVFIGLVPNTSFLEGMVELDERGFVLTEPGQVETNVEGVFAAGDCRRGAIAQVASATGEGVVASFAVRRFLQH